MALNIAVCVFLVLSSFSPVNGGLNASRTRMEEESSEHCDTLKIMLEEQLESYQFACGSNTDRPKVEPMDSFFYRVGKALATAYMQIPQA